MNSNTNLQSVFEGHIEVYFDRKLCGAISLKDQSLVELKRQVGLYVDFFDSTNKNGALQGYRVFLQRGVEEPIIETKGVTDRG